MEDAYRTRDLPLIAYLTLKNIHFNGRVSEGNVIYFVFPKDENLDSLVLDFQSGRGTVEPVAFWETLRRIRRLIKESLEVY